jgi:hypothetical protein
MDRTELDMIVREVVAELRRLNVVAEERPAYNIPPAAKELADQGRCLWCKEPLGDATPTRGLHTRCYRAMLRDLERRGETIEWAVSIGAAMPEGKPGPRAKKATRLDELAAQATPPRKTTKTPNNLDAEHAERLKQVEEKVQKYTAGSASKAQPRKNKSG